MKHKKFGREVLSKGYCRLIMFILNDSIPGWFLVLQVNICLLQVHAKHHQT